MRLHSLLSLAAVALAVVASSASACWATSYDMDVNTQALRNGVYVNNTIQSPMADGPRYAPYGNGVYGVALGSYSDPYYRGERRLRRYNPSPQSYLGVSVQRR